MKVIVTGATGNLGSHIVANPGIDFLPIGRENWDKLKSINASEYNAVIHCAYDLKNSINVSPTKNLDSNIMSTARVLELCEQKKIKKFVFISSCAVYGDSSNSAEDKPCQPITMNGHIKLFNEELVKSFCHHNGINYQILRVFNTFGGDDNFSVVQKLITCAKMKTPFLLVNDGVSERDFIHVEDVAKIVCQLLTINLTNEVINIGSGQSVKIIDLAKSVERKIGKIVVNKKENPNEAIFSVANIKKLKGLVQFEPINVIDFIDKM